MVLTDTGLAKVFQRIKSFIASQLNSKASAIHTHTVSDVSDFPTNYVTTDTTQTIGGNKTFSNGLFASKSTAGDLAILEDSSINSTNEDANGMPLTNHTNSLRIKGSQNSVLPLMITAQVATSGDTSTEFRVYKYKDLNKRAEINIYYTYANDKARAYFTNFDYVLPYASNTTNLGSSSLQWNNTYIRNILIDNDINIASSLINKTSNSGVLTVRGGINDTEGASLSLYGKDYGGSPGLIGNIYMTAYGNSDYTNFRIYPNGIIRVYNNSTATTKNVAMQEDVVNLTTAQTIGGAKTFYTSATAYPIIKLKTAFIEQGLYDSDNLRGVAFRCADKNDAILGDFGYKTERTGEVGSYFSARTKVNNTQTTREIKLRFKPGSTDCELVPDTTNLIDLGSSTNKWKSFNGINPGALSYPNKSSYINIDTTNWDLTCSNQGVMANYTAEESGWLLLQIRHGSADIVDLWLVTDSIRMNSKSTLNTLDNRNFNMISLPVVKGETLRIFGDASQYVAGRVIDYARIYRGLGQ